MNVKSFIFTCFLFATVSGLSAQMSFITNKGQSPENVNYEFRLPNGKVFFEDNQWTFNFIERPNNHKHHNHKHHGHKHNHGKQERAKGHAFKMNFLGGRENAYIKPEMKEAFHHNYFIGNDQSKWAGNVPLYKQITYFEMYECIDLKVYSTDESLKYDFIVHEDGDPTNIQIQYDGVDDIYIKDKNLIIKTSVNEITELKPYAYQILKGRRKKIHCDFHLDKERKIVSFKFPRGYKLDETLIIDPDLIFSSYSGSPDDNWGYTATYDDDGNLYGGGISFGTKYPVQSGSYDTQFNGGDCDIAISKFNPTGTDLVYSTFIGGNSTELPHSMIVNSKNELVIFGTSGSSNYPVTSNAYDKSYAGGQGVSINLDYLEFPTGSDIIVTVLNQAGSALVGSTYFGGTRVDGLNITANNGIDSTALGLFINYGDHARGEVNLDENDNIYIASSTFSTSISGTNNLQQNHSGLADGIVAKFSPDVSNLNWFTYLGGSRHDAAYSLKVHPETNDVYVCGGTQSTNMPATNGLNSSFKGGSSDGYVIRINNAGNTFLGGTYIGTDKYDQVHFVEIDIYGDIYVTGQTIGAFPVSVGVYSNIGSSQFIQKLNPTLTTNLWSTVFGNGKSDINISPTAFLVDVCGRIYVSGWGGETNTGSGIGFIGNTENMFTSEDAFQRNTDGSDFYFIVFEKDAKEVLYATYFGGSNNTGEHVDGGTSRFDKNGIIYQAVCAGCFGANDFPTTESVWSRENGSERCNLGVIKFNFDPKIIEVNGEISPRQTGCAPFKTKFNFSSTYGEEYYWDFGDGSTSTDESPEHEFTEIGEFNVTVVVIDSTTCNIRAEDTIKVIVPDSSNFYEPVFDFQLPDRCDSTYSVGFTNLSTYEFNLSEYNFTWDYGDGDTSKVFEEVHFYDQPGTYTVSLRMKQNSCPEDTVSQTLVYLQEVPLVDASFDIPDKGCIPLPVVVSALDDAQEYIWDFGDGTSYSGEKVEQHVYQNIGDYTITLTARDDTTCNMIDVVSQDIEVFGQPVAAFTYDQPTPYILVDITFVNFSEPDDIEYFWDFGDGSTSIEKNPTHSYTKTGDIEVCLTATQPVGKCDSTVCDIIYIDDAFKFQIPTAFSPNGDGVHDVYRINGFGVEEFELYIFNRWGEMVYSSNKFDDKWDGVFKGKEQEIGVYLYYLEATVAGGKTYTDKGNITLIR